MSVSPDSGLEAELAVSDRIKLGMALPQHSHENPPDMALVRNVARRAEDLGYEGLWTVENILSSSSSLEPLTLLSHVAALTTRVRLGVSVIVFPLRNPVQLAKTLSSLDHVCGGRFTVGLGIGTHEDDYPAYGIPAKGRARRFNEGLAVMKALWTQAPARHSGELYTLSGVNMEPKPLQKPHMPIWLGGAHPNVYKRAARHADGWMGSGSSSLAAFKERVPQMLRAMDEAGRDRASFTISKRVYLAIDDQPQRAYERLAVWFGKVYGNADMARQVAVVGNARQVRERIEEVASWGVDHLLLHPMVDFEEHVDALAEITGLKKGAPRR